MNWSCMIFLLLFKITNSGDYVFSIPAFVSVVQEPNGVESSLLHVDIFMLHVQPVSMQQKTPACQTFLLSWHFKDSRLRAQRAIFHCLNVEISEELSLLWENWLVLYRNCVATISFEVPRKIKSTHVHVWERYTVAEMRWSPVKPRQLFDHFSYMII